MTVAKKESGMAQVQNDVITVHQENLNKKTQLRIDFPIQQQVISTRADAR